MAKELSSTESRRSSHPTAGFTLIELLLVIGIVAAVIAIAMPVVSGVRSSARRIACLSQLRDLGTGVTLYRGAHDDLLPYADDSVDIPNGRSAPLFDLSQSLSIRLPTAIAPDQTDAAAPFRCPADPVAAKRFGTSYRYELWPVWSFMGSTTQRLVSSWVANGQWTWIFRESLAFHARSASLESLQSVRGRNALRADGSVFAQE